MEGSSNTGSPVRRSRGRPPRIDKAQAVAAALAVLDAEGLDALTMRRLATELGVQVGTLYGYFADKPALLTEMAEQMLAGCADPAPTGTWPEQAAELARRLRQALLRHRDGARVYAGTHTTGPNTLTYANTFLGVLRQAGFTPVQAARASFTTIHFTLGHTLEEQAGEERRTEDLETLRRALGGGDYPHLSLSAHIATTNDFEAYFEFGLTSLLTGFANLLAP
ncbi:TetR/AcrR family tetracycline transcriptional repressor [Crossiella equi]|uniref:TetR/AcrR family tetracycline transcriptional repressor n=1 Tax=Crossiella equi TaxID=130796 RepID=A0ABS5AP30_9PSEU|nr:TetR/AcrR family transcriptional regulator [Crossiella equi]MBP2478333.1 TetR/AcrR family tetracycline transcriptional repressor [Crossiella equi]